MSPDTLRKAGVGIALADEAGVLKFRDSSSEEVVKSKDGVAATIPEADTNGFIERQKIRDLRTEIRAELRAESRSQSLQEVVAEAIKNLKPINVERIIPWSPVDEESRSLVVALGDFHYGSEFTVCGLDGDCLNLYNPATFEQRMGNLLVQLEEIIEKEKINTVEVMLVGDLIDGMLRDSQLMRLKYGIVDSTIHLSEYLAVWLARLSDYVSVVKVHACTGNHSEIRPLGSKARQFEEENMERIIMWYLQERLKKISNIIINPNTGRRVLAKVQGYNFLLLHGDGASYKNISDIARDTVNLYGTPIDFFVCGHLHNEVTMQSGMTKDGRSYIIRVPSLCGVDCYAQSKELGGQPGAVAMVIEKGYGRKCVYPISL